MTDENHATPPPPPHLPGSSPGAAAFAEISWRGTSFAGGGHLSSAWIHLGPHVCPGQRSTVALCWSLGMMRPDPEAQRLEATCPRSHSKSVWFQSSSPSAWGSRLCPQSLFPRTPLEGVGPPPWGWGGSLGETGLSQHLVQGQEQEVETETDIKPPDSFPCEHWQKAEEGQDPDLRLNPPQAQLHQAAPHGTKGASGQIFQHRWAWLE